MPSTPRVHAFRSHGTDTLYGIGTLDEARRYEALLNRDRAVNHFQLVHCTDGEAALNAGKTFSIKQQTIRLLLGVQK